MEKRILDSLKELLEKQDMLSKLTEEAFLDELGYSEIHCIDAIGKIKDPNVTKLANQMKMTKGAISKITTKLMNGGFIDKYSKDGNAKEIFYSLTPQGKKMFQEHLKRHELWEERDLNFLNSYSNKTLKEVDIFLNDFNTYLENQILLLTKKEEKNNVD